MQFWKSKIHENQDFASTNLAKKRPNFEPNMCRKMSKNGEIAWCEDQQFWFLWMFDSQNCPNFEFRPNICPIFEFWPNLRSKWTEISAGKVKKWSRNGVMPPCKIISKEFSFSYNRRNQFHIVSQNLRIFGGFIFSIH